MAVASLILGIVSLVFALIIPGFQWLAPIIGIVGIILGALAKKNSENSGMATAGLVMSIIGTVLGIICFIACTACIGAGIGGLAGLESALK